MANSKSITNNKSLEHYIGTTNIPRPSSISGDVISEPAVVLDIILDDTHELFNLDTKTKLDASRWPEDIKGKQPSSTDKDLTWTGRVLLRLLHSQKNVDKQQLIWALPLETNIVEYPLINETVIAVKYLNRYFYTRTLNYFNIINNNVDFNSELIAGTASDTFGNKQGNVELTNGRQIYLGPLSKTKYNGGFGYQGAAGRYYKINNRIRAIRKFEGDFTVESRHGQSIRFSVYDSNRQNDKGLDTYSDYKSDGNLNPYNNIQDGFGNPMVLIRNRQRPVVEKGKTLKLHDKLPTIVGTDAEKNVGGYIEEDVNNDGSSIHITSGLTISKFISTCYKSIFQTNGEEQKAFSPMGCTSFTYPTLDKDQIVINTDRLILSSRFNETLHFSKKRYSIVTDDELTIDSHKQIVITTNTKTVINSPAIYLGQYDVTSEPALLGQTTVNWLYDLCNLLLEHTHHHIHSHVDAGEPSPKQTQTIVQREKLIKLRDSLHTLMSRRVFITGGGFAPGVDGGSIKDGSVPVSIDVNTGNGLPGGWVGANRR